MKLNKKEIIEEFTVIQDKIKDKHAEYLAQKEQENLTALGLANNTYAAGLTASTAPTAIGAAIGAGLGIAKSQYDDVDIGDESYDTLNNNFVVPAASGAVGASLGGLLAAPAFRAGANRYYRKHNKEIK